MMAVNRILRSFPARMLPALLWMAAIFAMSAQHAVPQPPGLSTELTAIAGHLVSYGLLALLLLWALPTSTVRPRYCFALAILLASLYGLSDEFHQSFVPGRSATVFDVCVDALGAVLAISLYAARRSRLQSRTQ
jgi:VanZ family protein